MADTNFDIVIIGAGPGGLTAAIYGQRAGLKCLVLDPNPIGGGKIQTTNEVDNYPGLPGVGGMELGMKFEEHAKKLGAEMRTETVSSVSPEGKSKLVVTDKSEYLTKAVIISTGTGHKLLGVPGEKDLTGSGVSYCATCDGAFFRNKKVAVIGGGDVALEDALFLARTSETVYLIPGKEEITGAKILQDQVAGNDKIQMIDDKIVKKIEGKFGVDGLILMDKESKEESALEVKGVFIAVGSLPNTEHMTGLAKTDERGYLIAGEDCRTDIAGLYAAGDVRSKAQRQVVTAAADGANSIVSIQQDMRAGIIG